MKRSSSRKPAKKTAYKHVLMVVCAAFWVIYPFIVRLVLKKVPQPENEYFATTKGYIADLMLYCKEIALAVFTGLVLLYFLGSRIFPDNIDRIDRDRVKRLKLPLICISGYIILAVLSCITGGYPKTAFWGVNTEYEGLLAIICYAMFFVFAMYYEKTGAGKAFDPLLTIKKAVLVLGLTAGVLSAVEIFYKPILEIGFIQDLIAPSEYRELAHQIKNENFIGQISLTFNNPGFLGSFCALFIPLGFCIANGEKRAWRAVGILGTGLLGAALIRSTSKVAMISLIVTIPVSFFIMIRTEKGSRTAEGRLLKNALGVFLPVLAITALVIGLSELMPASGTEKGAADSDASEAADSGIFRLTKAEIIEGELYLYSGEELLKISIDEEIFDGFYDDYENSDFSSCLVFSDGESRILGKHPVTLKATSIRDELSGFSVDDDRFSAVKISVDKELMIVDLGYPGTVEFYLSPEGIMLFGQGSTHLSEIPQPRVTGLERFYSFGTGRGYIWAQSLPILKESLLLGKGNGTFAFRFRQNEIAGLLNTHGSCKYVIDRPHNWYIRMACSAGVPACILIIVLFVSYIVMFIRKTAGDHSADISTRYITIGLFAGSLGFMICGLINDSCITVNPLFWVLFGCAYGALADEGR